MTRNRKLRLQLDEILFTGFYQDIQLLIYHRYRLGTPFKLAFRRSIGHRIEGKILMP